MYLIDAEALEKEGWYIDRIIQTGKSTMEYQTRKPTEFHAIEPERKTGKWIYDTCSKCGKDLWDYFHFTEDGRIIEEPNFCPNCGVDMRGKHNDND